MDGWRRSQIHFFKGKIKLINCLAKRLATTISLASMDKTRYLHKVEGKKTSVHRR